MVGVSRTRVNPFHSTTKLTYKSRRKGHTSAAILGRTQSFVDAHWFRTQGLRSSMDGDSMHGMRFLHYPISKGAVSEP